MPTGRCGAFSNAVAVLALCIAVGGSGNFALAQGPVPEISAPSGTIAAYGGTDPPPDWLLANGDAVSRVQYAALFAVIQTKYGAGNGTTTFGLPDLRGRVPVGADDDEVDRLDENDQLGQGGGKEKHTMTTEEMPSHSHGDGTLTTSSETVTTGFRYDAVSFGSNFGGLRAVAGADEWNEVSSPHTHDVSGSTGPTGNSNSHSIMQPFQIVSYIIKT